MRRFTAYLSSLGIVLTINPDNPKAIHVNSLSSGIRISIIKMENAVVTYLSWCPTEILCYVFRVLNNIVLREREGGEERKEKLISDGLLLKFL